MVTVLLSALALWVAVPIALLIVMAPAGWRSARTKPKGLRRRAFVVVIPAHNEDAVIGKALEDISTQDYPADLVEINVIADRCTDRTAEIASVFATVHVRDEGLGTKGAALDWFLQRRPLRDSEALVVLDADNRVPGEFLASMADALDEGHAAVQARLEPSNPRVSYVAFAAAMMQWLSNRLIDLPRANLGRTSSVLGTGFAITSEVVDLLGGGDAGLTEDEVLTDRLVSHGRRVEWLDGMRVLDEKPETANSLVRQRARWARGKGSHRRRGVRMLLASDSGITLDVADRLARLLFPGRIVSLTLLSTIAVVATLSPGTLAVPAVVPTTLVGVSVCLIIVALLLEGVRVSDIRRIPGLMLFVFTWLPERWLASRSEAWYNTPHSGADDGR